MQTALVQMAQVRTKGLPITHQGIQSTYRGITDVGAMPLRPHMIHTLFILDDG